MAANRGFVALLALVVLVWGVAFSGGLTVALLTSTADVTTTFETPDELAEIDESSGSGFAVVTVPVGNETATAGGNRTAGEANGTAPAANGTETGENVSIPTDGNVSAPADGNVSAPADGNVSAPAGENVSAPADGNVSAPADAPTQNESSPPSDAPGPVTNESAPAGNATAEEPTAPDANDFGAVAGRHSPEPSRFGSEA
ncbi:hypothetical protein C464_00344 [Halorubrum coriense DSM 10284]|uniref:Uncharacterized protein n=1 Tax=Halorubrum coriense DSM 10284 TaxID=1227466 RepID=M0EXJ3_9EURY|nr:hypothetical protein [Halorubrum coriense]ELZ51798.1 hypothetical protein C464_00344 [Halorubrum coriense DSM 10284]